ncbi:MULTISPECIES: orotidine-5'-phosphate decarboxylase [unclassified Bradyrhizobium]|uniref:orotidine-5'-phosphate decarboxylase n=1 Tax=unclassified Bradyrhizobium TaxID=2631580 RepID=UPI001BA523BC|nr:MULTISPECIES: orotidine-5'-phosphate decarboxylase [unclassified Bradyrhizobium]MBR1227041.1 orotidine-5'-phosphate decarboxylase [Bradyrhizobium sp. AUGA SZCCT0176]MBR1296569.1 orotidine-5'-phosphate decarboxylase [Bradyrhizobium sp. AUGA SZCCT0042]
MDAPSWIELVERNVARFGDLVAGIDPSLSDIPEFFGHDSGWIDRFVNFTIETIEGRIGFVKFQSAYFEACGLTGLTALASGIKKARAAGIGVILDAKRGDIGATAAAYARAYLTPASAGGSGDFEADCLTVNPLMGPDTLEPFVECANRFGKGLFVLCRTSNPGAGWLQDKMTGNRLVSDRFADLIAAMGVNASSASRLNAVGAVVGATVPHEGRRLRQLLPRSIILGPGLGAQGGDAAAIHSLRGNTAGDLLIPVSRGLTRVADHGISAEDYRALIIGRIDDFKTAIAYDYRGNRAIPA